MYGFPGDVANPLHDRTRVAGPNDRIPPIYVGPTLMKPIKTAASFNEFGGSGDQELPVAADVEGDPQQMGQLEMTPHGVVHVWTTDPTLTSERGLPNMGALASAGFDPVFFAHHCNIDRLWDVWTQQQGHANPDNPRWLRQPFLFYDDAQTWTRIRGVHTTDPVTSLSYRYQPPTWPAAPPPAAMMAAAARVTPRVAQMRPLSAPLVELSRGEPKALPPQPTTVQVAVPQQAKAKISALAAPANPEKLVLRIDGVEIPADRRVLVQVYVNRPDITAAARGPVPGYVGSIVVVPSIAEGAGAHGHETVYRNFGFALAPELVASLANQDNISVTLVPVTGATDKPAEILRYRRVYLASR